MIVEERVLKPFYDFITKKPMGQNVIYSITEKGTIMLNLFTRTEKN